MNPLVDRFNGISEKQYIIYKTTVVPDSLNGLEACSIGGAASYFAAQLSKVYVPNNFAIEFIQEMIERSARYCLEKYSSQVDYNRSIFHPTDSEVFPIALTGLAGVGKSALINALKKVLPEPIVFTPDIASKELYLLSHWAASGRGKPTLKQLLNDLIETGTPGGIKNLTVAQLLKSARSYAGKVGLPLILFDEVQHVTQGDATAHTIEILLSLAKIGVPMVYISNYSLQHKFLLRNAEERHRLMSNPRVMEPDLPNSGDWRAYVEACVQVLGPYLKVRTVDIVEELYEKTFGLKRLVVHLLASAYTVARRSGRHEIEFADLDRAFLSAGYTEARNEVLILQRQLVERKSVRSDLWCPYIGPRSPDADDITLARKLADERLARTAFESALTPWEKEELRHAQAETGSHAAETKPAKKPRPATKRTYDNLKAGYDRQSIKGQRV
ncbi:ATP-binding protein [Pseudomonas sp. NY15366]